MYSRASSTVVLLEKLQFRAISSSSPTIELQYPFITQDTFDHDPSIKNWRIMPAGNNHAGPVDIWASASAVPRQCDFKWIKDTVIEMTNVKSCKVIIVDLRQECHGYLNGHAINLTGEHNWINQGKNHDEVITAENAWLNSLAQSRQSLVRVNKNLRGTELLNSGENVAIHDICSERNIVEEAELGYFRITVADHGPPTDEQVDQFLKLISELDENTWLHYHCRGGAGRSTTFLIMHYMLKYANQFTFDSIIELHVNHPPKYDIRRGSAHNTHLKECYENRYKFLGKFYEFAQARLNQKVEAWAEWVNRQAASDDKPVLQTKRGLG